MRRNGPLVRVVCFHDIADGVWFERVIKELSMRYALITPQQFYNNEFDVTKINILLTFDDGYQTWIDNGLPVLKKYSAKGIFFINSGLLDYAEDADAVAEYYKNNVRITPKKPLTWDDTQLLLSEGHTIGGHTVTHPNLALLDTKEATREIVADKKRHEHILGVTLRDFAFPFGTKRHFTKQTIEVVLDAGYTMPYSAITGFYKKGSQTAIPRTLIENNQNTPSLHRFISGGYDCFSFLKK